MVFTGIALPSCAAGDSQRASLVYDIDGKRILYAYVLAPADTMGQAEKIANRMYGTQNLRQPKGAYFCTWRDTGPTQYVNKSRGYGQPSTIFIVCLFGSEQWSPPAGLLEAAAAHAKREAVLVRVTWERRGGAYVMSNFGFRVERPTGQDFSSQNQNGKELAEIRSFTSSVDSPNSPQDPVRFKISATVPSRLNGGDPAKGPYVPLEIEGIAQPSPEWLLY